MFPASSYGAKLTSKQWLKNSGFSTNICVVTAIFKLSILEAMIDFPVIGSDKERNPIRKYPYYHSKNLHSQRAKCAGFSMQKAFNYILLNFAKIKGFNPVDNKQFKKLLSNVYLKESAVSDMSGVMAWRKSADILKSKSSIKVVSVIATCSNCKSLPGTTISSKIFYCRMCKVILIVK